MGRRVETMPAMGGSFGYRLSHPVDFRISFDECIDLWGRIWQNKNLSGAT